MGHGCDSEEAAPEVTELQARSTPALIGSDSISVKDEDFKADKDIEKVAEYEYPHGLKLSSILVALFVTEFLVGLDQTIVAAAIPKISNDFNALNQIGWYGSAYLLTSCSLQPLYGRAYAYFPQKLVFILALVLFELGSVVSAVAQSSPVFILGRALQGAGYAGLFIGLLAIGSVCLPIHLQPLFTAMIGGAYGLGAVLGPLIGGALTSKVSWRWAFWINLPPGALTALVIYFFCHPPPLPQTLSVKDRFKQMDWFGAGLLLSSTVCLLMALQDGGIITPWRSAKIIGLLVGFFMILVAFFLLQFYLKDNSSISMRLLGQRNLFAIAFLNFTVGATYYSLLYYVPVFFQAVQGSTPIRSGVQMLPIILPVVAGNVGTGWLVSHYRTYHWEMLIGAALSAIGAGLLATMDASTGLGKWVVFQLIAGAGMGSVYMQGYIATQATLPVKDRHRGASVVVFTQLWGATLWVSTSEAIYQCRLLAGITNIPGLDIASVVDSGVSKFRDVVPAALLPEVVAAAANSLFDVFVAIAAMSSIGFIAIFWMDWKKIDGK